VITDRPIVPEAHMADSRDPGCGALATFTGTIRSHNKGRNVTKMYYDCYREMAERELTRLVDEIKGTLPVKSVRVVHRIGDVPVGEISLFVAVSSMHREAAFEACRRTVDGIKHRIPIWKKEYYDDKTSAWI
jgi:molybdopterin synthase catalytic subunit